MNKIAIIFLSVIVFVHLHAMNFNVTTTSPSGVGSLGEAITLSNANGPGPNTITFTGAGVGTISVSAISTLPPITIPVTINVTSEAITIQQDGSFGNVLIGLQIDVGGSGSTIQDMTIQNFGPNNPVGADGTGVFLNGASNVTIDTCTIQNNDGGNPNAPFAPGGDGTGINISGGSSNTVQNCTIIGNNGGSPTNTTSTGIGGAGFGVIINNSNSNIIQTSSITGNSGGTGGSGGGGGSVPGSDGGPGYGVDIIGTSANNLVQNNDTISNNNGGNGGQGQDNNGGNGAGGHGVRINASSSNSVLNNILINANNGGNGGPANNTGGSAGIGGSGGDGNGILITSTADGDNIVSGNIAITNHIGGIGQNGDQFDGGNGGNGYGIRIDQGADGNNTVQNNGTISGNTGGNAGNGGSVSAAPAGDGGNGGTGAGISFGGGAGVNIFDGNGPIQNNNGGNGGNGGDGFLPGGSGGDGGNGGNASSIELISVLATGNSITDNTIDLNGSAGTGGAAGLGGGGGVAGIPGLISGVLIDTGDENPILNNMITGNSSAFGIRLINGGNNDQVEPTLTNVELCDSIDELTVVGSLTGTDPSTTFTIQVFTNGSSSDPEQGRTFMGEFSVMTDGAGNVNFNEIITTTVGAIFDFITATATRISGITSTDTSEFSTPFQIVTDAPPIAMSQNLMTDIDTPINGVLMATDPEMMPLIFAITSGPSNGVISNFNASTGAFTYTPNPGFLGYDSFMFTATDDCNTSLPGTINIAVINNSLILGDGINPNNNILLEVFPAAVLQVFEGALVLNDA